MDNYTTHNTFNKITYTNYIVPSYYLQYDITFTTYNRITYITNNTICFTYNTF